MSKMIKLCVGGTTFTTTLETLTNDPECMLARMFSGKFVSAQQNEKGEYFIDRDGAYFNYILNYLRDGYVPLPLKAHQRAQILMEARYFQVKGLVYQLAPNLMLDDPNSTPLEQTSLYLAHVENLRANFQEDWLRMKNAVKSTFVEQIRKGEYTLNCRFPPTRANVDISPFVLRELKEEGLKSLNLSKDYQLGVSFTLDLSAISELDILIGEC